MKKIILICFFIFVYCDSVNASEITGEISTNMKPIINNGNGGNEPAGSGNNNSGGGSGGDDNGRTAGTNNQGGRAVIINNQTNIAPNAPKKEEKKQEENNDSGKINSIKDKIINKVKVLGISGIHLDNGMLARGPDMRVYVIEKGMKRYIPGIKELIKYAGRKIFDVSGEDIGKYKDIEKKYSDGQLIRGWGDVKVYAIKNGMKRHIASYEELKKNYFGMEIINVNSADVLKYTSEYY